MHSIRTGIDMAANLSTVDSVDYDPCDYMLRIINIEEEKRKAKIRELNERLEKLRKA